MKIRIWPILLLVILLLSPVQAQDINADQLQELGRIRLHLETLDELQAKGALDADTAQAQQDEYLASAAQILGRDSLTRDELTSLTGKVELSTPGVFSRIGSYITLVNIIMVTAAILLAIAIGWLAFLYVVPFLAELGPKQIQFLAYSASGSAVLFSKALPAVAQTPTAFIGCLLLIGCVSYTESCHGRDLGWDSAAGRFSFYSGALCAVWSIAAVAYGSSLIGFIAVGAFVSMLGFSVLVMPLCYCIGFKDDEAVVRATTAAGIMVGFYTAFHATGVVVPDILELFRPGGMWIGTFVYFLGLLIMASKFYSKDVQYVCAQLLMIASGIAAISIGTIYQIPTLQRIGGTLFYLYAIEKYFEIPWGETSWAWITLIFSGLLYGGALFAQAHPAYFLF